MKEDESLSDKITRVEEYDLAMLNVEDVKEFVKKLKEELCSCKLSCVDYNDYSCEEVKKIDKLAGKELT